MIDAAECLLAELDSAGVVLSIFEDGLAFDGPEDLLTDDLMGMMRMHRDDLLALVVHREERLAWLAVDGSLVRADAEDVDVVGVHPDDVDTCPGCGDLCDTMTVMGGWSCSRCEPERTATTARWLAKRERILARRR